MEKSNKKWGRSARLCCFVSPRILLILVLVFLKWTPAAAQGVICNALIELYNSPNKENYRDIIQREIDSYDTWIEDTLPSLIRGSKYPPYFPLVVPAHIRLNDYDLDYLVAVTMHDLDNAETDYNDIDIYNHLIVDSTRVFVIMTKDKSGHPIGFTGGADIGAYRNLTNKNDVLYSRKHNKEFNRLFKQIRKSHPDALLYFSNMDRFGYIKDNAIYIQFKDQLVELSAFIEGYISAGCKLANLDCANSFYSYKDSLKKRNGSVLETE